MAQITRQSILCNFRKNLEFLYKEFIYGGHLQSLGASSIVYISTVFLGIELKWSSLAIAYLLFYPLYLYNRWKEIEIDYLTNPDRTAYLKTYIHYMPVIFWSVVVIIISLLAFWGNSQSFVFGTILLVLGLLYTTVFKSVTKKIFLFKNFYVASFFTFLVFFTPVYYSFSFDDHSFSVVFVLMIFVFLKAFVMQILLDLKDVESDREQELKTLGVAIGKENTFKILYVLSILTTAPIVIFYSLYVPLFDKIMLMFLLTIPFNFISFKLAQNKNYFGYILGSGEFLLWAILILFGKVLTSYGY